MKLILYTLIFFSIHLLYAQEIHFSDIKNSTVTLNPALVGNSKYDFKSQLVYRSQFETFSKAYTTIMTNTEISVLDNNTGFFCSKKLNVGISYAYDKAGSLNLNTSQLNLSLSYSQFLDKKKKSQILFGLQTGYTFRTIDLSKAQTGSQFYNQYESIYLTDPDILKKSNYFNIAAGIGFGIFPNKKVSIFLGGAFYNLARQNISFVKNKDIKQYLRYTTQGSVNISATTKVKINPYYNLQFEGPAKEYTMGLECSYIYSQKKRIDNSIIFGVAYRYGDAVIPKVGVSYRNYIILVNYDINISKLVKASKSVGAFEVSLTFNNDVFKNREHCKDKKTIPCVNF
ncbi:MAG: PorP/SprF family type IX secretion system membrane protein [Sphingobacteriales bacterium]|nr:PorP/SprF family type IX secretion system membrane protein [Sphingobacteriales bacterium]